MITTETLKIALAGKHMREAQTNYFLLIAKAKKNKSPDDFKAAKDMLRFSKDLEADFDQQVNKILGSQTLQA